MDIAFRFLGLGGWKKIPWFAVVITISRRTAEFQR